MPDSQQQHHGRLERAASDRARTTLPVIRIEQLYEPCLAVGIDYQRRSRPYSPKSVRSFDLRRRWSPWIPVDGIFDGARAIGVCSAFVRLHPLLKAGLADLLQGHAATTVGHTVSMVLAANEKTIGNEQRAPERLSTGRGVLAIPSPSRPLTSTSRGSPPSTPTLQNVSERPNRMDTVSSVSATSRRSRARTSPRRS
jgi:hypothetical protein